MHVHYTTHDLQRFRKQMKFPTPTSCSTDIYHRAAEVFDELWDDTPIRQFGISVSQLTPGGVRQLVIDDDFKREELEHIIDAIRNKYGDSSIYRASFMDSGLNHMIGGTMGGVGAARNFTKPLEEDG